MTNEEAIEYLKQADTTVYKKIKSKTAEALEIAIKALEQQPCEDTEVIKVSKGAVKSRQGRFVIYDVEWFKEHFYSEEMIYGQPKQPCEDCISREEAKQFLYERIDRLNDDELYDIFSRIIDDMYNELPPVTPQRTKGEWIYKNDNKLIASDMGYWQCSICEEGKLLYESPYCPNCGAEMSGGGADDR